MNLFHGFPGTQNQFFDKDSHCFLISGVISDHKKYISEFISWNKPDEQNFPQNFEV